MSVGYEGRSDDRDPSVIILQSLICMLRERNVLSRADIEELSVRVKDRMADPDHDPMACCASVEASTMIASLSDYIGRRYGGKHRRL